MLSLPNRFALAMAASCAGVTFTLATPARAEPPVCGYRWVEPEAPAARVARGATPYLVYLNRCAGGCTVYPGDDDDSQQNISIVPETISTLDEFSYGEQAWDELVACVRGLFSPFDLDFTEQDPGATPHVEAIVAGWPQDVGQDDNVGGIAPFNCGVVDDAIAFTFAEIYEDAPRALCETVAHEIGHTFGLDHEFWCPDPMTYQGGCGDKSFQDVGAECGEHEARDCHCGGTTQNSHARLASVLNVQPPAPPTPPSLEIIEPQDGDHIQPGFDIEIAAEDDVALASIAVYLDGVLVAESAVDALDVGPFHFDAPAQLPVGEIEVRAVATDDRGDRSEQAVTVVRPECLTDDDCGATEVCTAGACAGDQDAAPESEGGCRAAPRPGAGGLTAALVVVALLAGRRRRARPRLECAPTRDRARSR